MKTSRLLLAAFLLLAAGIWLLCNFTHGDAGFSASSNIPDTKVSLNLATTGWPAIIGVPSVLFGAILLVMAFFSAIVKEILLHRARKTEPALPEPLE